MGEERTYYGGIDVGASATKAVTIDGTGSIAAEAIVRTGVDLAQSADRCFAHALAAAGIAREDVASVVATGFGRHNVPFAAGAKTEIACHARGCFHHFPRPATIIDIGGQDAKMIWVDEGGKVLDFKMNRKCAAGTGAFVEEIAERLGVELAQLDGIASSSAETVELGSYCTVFTKTEVLARIREGRSLPAILRGVLASVVKRVFELGRVSGEAVLSGGVVAHNPLVARLMEERLGRPVLVPRSPQTIGALGAALFAAEGRRVGGSEGRGTARETDAV